jgi:CheY-like chemotaxis protein
MTPVIRILLAHTDSREADELGEFLVDLGHDVTAVVSDGRAALSVVGSVAVDLAIIDLDLAGDLDAVGLATALAPDLRLGIAFAGASADAATFQRAALVNPLGFLFRPYRRAGLEDFIASMLARSDARARPPSSGASTVRGGSAR